MTSAGPFLRYINCLPGSKEWTGSVLFLTKQPATETAAGSDVGAAAAAGSVAAGPNGATPTGGDATEAELRFTGAAPVLSIHDGAGSALEVQAVLLDMVLGWHFWRFNLLLQLGAAERPVRYVVQPPSGDELAATFWLPAAGRPFHWGYYSCNGLSLTVPDDHYARKDPTYLWRDLLQVHGAFPMHALVGGGDQVYADIVWREPSLAEWGKLERHEDKLAAPWTDVHQAQATASYLRTYLESFGTTDVSTALASIPNVMVWDDHDIWDGYGSYDADLQACPVFQGLFEVARRFYLLFQQHTTLTYNAKHSEFLHEAEGYHKVRFMGPQVALLCIDMRTRRTKKEILPESFYQLFRSAALELPESVHHVVVLSGTPVVFPNIPFSETILGGLKGLADRVVCCRSVERRVGLLDEFDQPEILDDLLDGWAANVHHDERLELIRLLQEVALTKGVRVSILSGDAHVGGVGRLYSRPKQDPRSDPLFMVQIISSAIMNAPPPVEVVRMLMRTNISKNVDHRTREKMVRAFWPHHPRTDKLIRRRNWCDVCLLAPPYAAPNNPHDPGFGAIRFALRVEDQTEWKGFAEEVYEIVVPRAPPSSWSGRTARVTSESEKVF